MRLELVQELQGRNYVSSATLTSGSLDEVEMLQRCYGQDFQRVALEGTLRRVETPRQVSQDDPDRRAVEVSYVLALRPAVTLETPGDLAKRQRR